MVPSRLEVLEVRGRLVVPVPLSHYLVRPVVPSRLEVLEVLDLQYYLVDPFRPEVLVDPFRPEVLEVLDLLVDQVPLSHYLVLLEVPFRPEVLEVLDLLVVQVPLSHYLVRPVVPSLLVVRLVLVVLVVQFLHLMLLSILCHHMYIQCH